MLAHKSAVALADALGTITVVGDTDGVAMAMLLARTWRALWVVDVPWGTLAAIRTAVPTFTGALAA